MEGRVEAANVERLGALLTREQNATTAITHMSRLELCTPQQTHTTVPVALWDAVQLGSTAEGASAFDTAVTLEEERFVLTPSALLTVLGEGGGGGGIMHTCTIDWNFVTKNHSCKVLKDKSYLTPTTLVLD